MTNKQKCCVLLLLVVILALGLRLPRLAERPMHGDEAIHAIKFGQLLEQGTYRYNPDEYHGPTLNYFTLIPAKLQGAVNLKQVNEVTLRIVPVFFGVVLILLLLLLADGLGTGAIIIAGLLTATSPAMVFYGRYYIQEMLLVCFTFGLIACGYRYVRGKSIVWAISAGAFAGLMHATKETCIIALGAMEKYEAALKGISQYDDALKKAQMLSVPIFNTERFLYFIGYKSQADRPGAF
jgi:uncharacterized protein (TIGR03663 family)